MAWQAGPCLVPVGMVHQRRAGRARQERWQERREIRQARQDSWLSGWKNLLVDWIRLLACQRGRAVAAAGPDSLGTAGRPEMMTMADCPSCPMAAGCLGRQAPAAYPPLACSRLVVKSRQKGRAV